MKVLLEKAKQQFEQNLPFVLYKKPNDVTVNGVLQENDTLYSVHDYSEKGFVFASFDGRNTYIIPENQSEIFRVDATNWIKPDNSQQFIGTSIITGKVDFENLVSKGIQAINQNELKKVVLSRKETLNFKQFDVIATFGKLVQSYPSTFVYCFYHPKVGVWMGATPEQLLKSNHHTFETMALAGTQKDTQQNPVIWPKKEQEEQQYVTDYIVGNLQNIASDLQVSSPYSIKAGSIWHIKTDISGTFDSGFGLQKGIQLLHPTPAVCGLPKDVSKAFILENEGYNRTFYTGFLGELNIDKKTDLFVNLRCMEIEIDKKETPAKAHLFMGCGITKDSNPEKEWEESVNKSATMRKVLDF